MKSKDPKRANPTFFPTPFSLLDVGFTNTSLATTASEVGRHARRLFIPTSGASSSNIEVYVNYGHGDEGPLGWYAERKLPRLNALKETYDPHRLFSHYNALEATYDVPKSKRFEAPRGKSGSKSWLEM